MSPTPIGLRNKEGLHFMRHITSLQNTNNFPSSIHPSFTVTDLLDFLLGLRIFFREEWEHFSLWVSKTYDSILREGRNNNSDIAIRIRESVDSMFEFLENLNTNKKV
jgi:hypothetical protein